MKDMFVLVPRHQAPQVSAGGVKDFGLPGCVYQYNLCTLPVKEQGLVLTQVSDGNSDLPGSIDPLRQAKE
jgi:hypothetical protein